MVNKKRAEGIDGAFELMKKANEFNAQVVELNRQVVIHKHSAVVAAWHCGRALLEAKMLYGGYGVWADWRNQHFDGSQPKASRYEAIAEYYKSEAELPPSINQALQGIQGRNPEGSAEDRTFLRRIKAFAPKGVVDLKALARVIELVNPTDEAAAVIRDAVIKAWGSGAKFDKAVGRTRQSEAQR